MKIRRQKKVSKHMMFYTNFFGFRKPYQLLVDGTFCLAALRAQVNIADNIPRYLQGDMKIITTMCSILEVEKLGKKLYGALNILKQYIVHKCGHDGTNPLPASHCLLSMLKKNNEAHYIVATQDRQLQERIRKKSAVPLLYLNSKTPILDPPSPKSLDFVKAKNTTFNVAELEQLKEIKSERANEIAKRKRKKAKGPNPLSCMKKKKKTNAGKVEKRAVAKSDVEKQSRKIVADEAIVKVISEELNK